MAIIQELDMSVGEIKSYGYLIGSLARSVESDPDSCAWSVDSGTSVTIEDSSLTASNSSVVLKAVSEGCSIIKGVLTFDDGQIVNLFFHVTVSNPEC